MANLNIVLMVLCSNVVIALSQVADEAIVKPPPATHGVRVLPPGIFNSCLILISLNYMRKCRLSQTFVNLKKKQQRFNQSMVPSRGNKVDTIKATLFLVVALNGTALEICKNAGQRAEFPITLLTVFVSNFYH